MMLVICLSFSFDAIEDPTSTKGGQLRDLDGVLACGAWDVSNSDYVLLTGCICVGLLEVWEAGDETR